MTKFFSIISNFFERQRQSLDYIRRDNALQTNTFSHNITRQSVNINTEPRRVQRRITLRKQRRNHARQNIAAASRRHTRIASGIEINIAVSIANRRICTLQHYYNIVFLRLLRQQLNTPYRILRPSKQPLKLFKMRRNNGIFGQQAHLFGVCGENIEGVGIHYKRLEVSLQQFFDGVNSDAVRTDARGNASGGRFAQRGKIGNN